MIEITECAQGRPPTQISTIYAGRFMDGTIKTFPVSNKVIVHTLDALGRTSERVITTDAKLILFYARSTESTQGRRVTNPVVGIAFATTCSSIAIVITFQTINIMHSTIGTERICIHKIIIYTRCAING
eukprot:Lithocolla_globosa_v1_NODE_779_length_3290_cov_4.506955.p2 type:complete len:129 gc:universal NODE_779_length_3290_cov_4.506955:1518-1132(-)